MGAERERGDRVRDMDMGEREGKERRRETGSEWVSLEKKNYISWMIDTNVKNIRK